MVDVEEILPSIETISRVIASDFPDIDWKDVRQHLSLFVIEKSEQLHWEGNGGSVKKILKKVAHTYCKEERAQQQHLSIQYSYRPSDVMKILETAWSVIEIDKTYVPEDAVSAKPDSDPLDLASDVRSAYDRLPVDLRTAIFKRYALGEVPVHASYERKKLNKAIKDLTRILNNYRGRTTGRKAISNSKAQAIISKGY